jgi:hypothetical protein
MYSGNAEITTINEIHEMSVSILYLRAKSLSYLLLKFVKLRLKELHPTW